MFKKIDYLKFEQIIEKVLILDGLNRQIQIEKLKKRGQIKNELVLEFISTNNIEGDEVKMNRAKQFLKENENLKDNELLKRWIGIKYAHNIIWNENYNFSFEYIHEAHRALLRHSHIVGGVWKRKLNQVGSLITALPEDVPRFMNKLFLDYSSSKQAEGSSVFNIIPMISEFLAIHPYEDGNGRISRLLMNRELYDSGYKFTKYISVSKYLWENRSKYILALESRNNAWASQSMNPTHLVKLFNVILDALISAARKAIEIQSLKVYSKNDFIKMSQEYLRYETSILELMKDMKIGNSKSSIINWLNEMIAQNIITKTGEKKGTKYKKI